VTNADARPTITVTEYLRLDESSPVKHEYVAGEVYAMAGVTFRHNRISRNIVLRLSSAAGDGPCEVFSSDVRLRAADDVYYYPDVMVICRRVAELEVVATDPCVVIEVTSTGTARIDRGEKTTAYRAIPSVRTYLIVDHRRRRVERHWREVPDGEWRRDEIVGDAQAPIPIACLGASLTLDTIYRRVDLPAVHEPEAPEYDSIDDENY
jgi:Uma2 family endonuclease